MDQVSDMFTRIRNAQIVNKETVVIPYSKLKMKILEVMLKEEYIKDINKKGKKIGKIIEVVLLYDIDGKGHINEITRVSKPSKRVYIPSKKIKHASKGHLLILSTPKGILTSNESIKKGVGGEIICIIK